MNAHHSLVTNLGSAISAKHKGSSYMTFRSTQYPIVAASIVRDTETLAPNALALPTVTVGSLSAESCATCIVCIKKKPSLHGWPPIKEP